MFRVVYKPNPGTTKRKYCKKREECHKQYDQDAHYEQVRMDYEYSRLVGWKKEKEFEGI